MIEMSRYEIEREREQRKEIHTDKGAGTCYGVRGARVLGWHAKGERERERASTCYGVLGARDKAKLKLKTS